MQFMPYWHDTAPAFTWRRRGPVEGHYDVAVDRRGLHRPRRAARTLAMAGARVVRAGGGDGGFRRLGP